MGKWSAKDVGGMQPKFSAMSPVSVDERANRHYVFHHLLRGWLGCEGECRLASMSAPMVMPVEIESLNALVTSLRASLLQAHDELEDLRQFKTWAEPQCQDYAANRIEIERLQAALEGIQQERLTWAMACECSCDACEKLSSVIRLACRDSKFVSERQQCIDQAAELPPREPTSFELFVDSLPPLRLCQKCERNWISGAEECDCGAK